MTETFTGMTSGTSAAARYAEQGMDVLRIQYLMGHANLKTTERYLNVNLNLLGQAMRKVMKW